MSEPDKIVPLDGEKITYFRVPAGVLKATLDVLNQLPRGQVNDLATALERCAQNGPEE